MRREALPAQKLFGSPILAKVAEQLHYADLEGLYVGIGEGHVSAKAVVQRIQRELRGGEEQLPTTVARPPRARGHRRTGAGVHVEGLDDVMVRLSRCCTPVPGDEIMGLRFEVGLADPGHLDSILAAVKRVDSVYDAARVLPGIKA